MHSTSKLVISFMYILWDTECVVQRATCLMDCMDLLMMVICCTFSQMFKIDGLVISLKTFRLNLLCSYKTSMLKPLSLYMLLTVLNYLMMLYALFEVKFYDVIRVILYDIVWIKGIPFI